MKKYLFHLLALALAFASCSDDDPVNISTGTVVTPPVTTQISEGFYLLNEGTMGNNNCTLDYFSYSAGTYTRNIYSEVNPEVVKELGDEGNDAQIYNGRLYVTVTGSNKVEVMDAKTAKRITQIEIPRCRRIVFNGDKAYVSTFATAAENPTGSLVYEVDLTTSKTTGRIATVGYNPEGFVISNGKLYAANSYKTMGVYENTISVVDLTSFKEEKRIEVDGLNLYQLLPDNQGNLLLSTRGDYDSSQPALYKVNLSTQQCTKIMDKYVNRMRVLDNNLYILSAPWDGTPSFEIMDLSTQKITTANFITDESHSKLIAPYELSINKETSEIFITDAQNYKNNGYLYCYSLKGKLKWKIETGITPAHIAFLNKK